MTLGRALSDTFAGIRPRDAVPFIAAQLAGALLAALVARWLFGAGVERGDGERSLAALDDSTYGVRSRLLPGCTRQKARPDPAKGKT